MLSLMGAGPGQRAAAVFPPITGLRADFNPGKPSTVTIATGVSQLLNDYPTGGTANLVQATAANQPALISANLNGFDVLRFGGSGDELHMTSGSETNPSTLYLVVKINTWVDNSYIVDGRNVLGSAISMKNSSPTIYMTTGGSDVNANTDMVVGTWGIVTAVFNSSSSQLRVNKLTAIADGSLPGFGDPGGITLGTAGNLADPSNCGQIDVARLLSYGAAHDTATQNAIIDGLAAQYGLSV